MEGHTKMLFAYLIDIEDVQIQNHLNVILNGIVTKVTKMPKVKKLTTHFINFSHFLFKGRSSQNEPGR